MENTTDLRGAVLSGADLNRADLNRAILRNANLRNASLRSANLRNANLHYANLHYANLRSANLPYASLNGADLRNAILRDANLDGVIGLVDAGMSPTWYRTVAVRHSTGTWRIVAGCRNFTVSEALEHWAADATRTDDVSPAEQHEFIRSFVDTLPDQHNHNT